MQNKELEKQFEKLIKEHELIILKVCAIYVSHETYRQDLFQEIIIQLWKAYPKFKGESKLSTWLYRVAINTAISGLRKEKSFVQSYELNTLTAQRAQTGIDEEKEEQFKKLYFAIDQLNQIEKAIIMLYLEDRSYEEMKDILGINEGNLRVKMNRIKEKLRQLTQNN
ncbi:MAG: RNA polymerase sigma factor [Segetibacter sp.]